MISEEKVMREVRWLEKEADGMIYPTKSGFLHIIAEFKKRLEQEAEEFNIPECLRRD